MNETHLEVLSRLAGPGGVAPPEDLAPMLVEWRGRWRGRTAIALTPKSTQAVAAIMRYCAEHRIAVTPQGGNTGLVGGQIPMNGEVLLSLRRLDRIRDVSPLDNAMTLEAGVTLAAAQSAAASADRLFPLSIGSEGSCQIGGAISSNAGGVNVLRYGSMRDLVLGIEAVLPSGETWNGLKRLRKDNTGYDLKQLFIGGEGTLGVVTAATVKLFPRPRERVVAFVGLPDVAAAVRLLARVQDASNGSVTSFELMSGYFLGLAVARGAGTRRPLDGDHPWTALIEFSAGQMGILRPMAEAALEMALDAGDVNDAVIAQSEAEAAALWRLRHSIPEIFAPEGRAQGKFDISAPIASLPDFLLEADAAVKRVDVGARIVAFGHLGDGNIHYDVLKPEGAHDDDFAALLPMIEQAVHDTVARFEGSISAEHGVGQARRAEIARRKSPVELAMMHAVKAAFDPHGIMNPGKML